VKGGAGIVEGTLSKPLKGSISREGMQAGVCSITAVEKNDVLDAGGIVRDQLREFECGDLDGGFAGGARGDRSPFEFREELNSRVAKTNLMRVADDGSVVLLEREIGRVVTDVGPACARTSEGERGFAGAGVSAEQHAASEGSDAGGVERGGPKSGEHCECSGFEEVVTKVERGLGGGASNPAEGIALLEVGVDEVARVCDVREKVLADTAERSRGQIRSL
jgi:hypothetical protein